MSKSQCVRQAGAAALLAGLLLSGQADAQTYSNSPSYYGGQTYSYAQPPLFPFPIFRGVAPAETVREPAIQQSIPRELDDAAPLDPRLRRQVVSYSGREPAGTVIIDTPNTYLYYVLGNGQAVRYGIGVGRDGFTWSGTEKISKKTEWPDWYPPADMIARQPYLPRFVAGGESNPLGARALYLGNSAYRIHGTNVPSTIGGRVSSGCIRMQNEDVIDLYSRVNVGTKVVVLPDTGRVAAAQAASRQPASLSAPLSINGRVY
jgi:lipoprotein-anchoring transpeptidase ErfK/SrfK